MKLDNNSIAVLKNFATLNCNLWVDSGTSELVTCTAKKNVLCRAALGNDFPVSFGIYDLNNFLGAVSLFQDTEIEFDSDEFCLIRDGKDKRKKLKYYFASQKTLITPAVQDIPIADSDIVATFELNDDQLKSILKSASLMQLDSVCIGIDDSAASIGAKNTENETKQSNVFSIDITDSITRGPAFDGSLVELALDKILVNPMPFSYNVTVTKRVIKFTSKSPDTKIVYWYAPKRNV